MKQRTTFLLPSLESIDTDNILFSADAVKVPASVFTARQDRLILPKEELPPSLAELFGKLYMFRVQWSQSRHNEVFQNFAAHGLSVHLVPTVVEYEEIFDEFGQFMNTSFGVLFHHDDMISTATSASINIQKEVKSSIFEQLLNTVVGKLDRVAYIQSFDIIWEQSELSISWTSEPYDSKIDRANHRKEIALFQSRDLFGDLELSGIRTVIGDEYTAPERTLIIVKPRHNTLKESVSVSLSSGLHPRLHINGLSARPYPSCELFAITNLPKELFFDRYQYNEQKLALLNSWGESDLEAPAWKVSKGSVQLFHILHNESVEIPFHSRYIKPSSPNEFTLAPQLFWGCEAETIIEDWEHMETNPFDTYNLGYESFFEPSTIFYHYSIDPLSLKIPTGDSSNYNLVQFSTIISVVLATCYLVQKIWISYQHSSQKLNTD